MIERLKFHLDESMDNAIAEGLRRQKIDVTTTPGLKMLGISDEEQVAFALQSGRVILTHDADFLRLHRQGFEHAGIVYCQQGRRSIGEIIRSLIRIWEMQTPASMFKHIEFI